ncbi:MAG: hypothetical protein ACYCZB_17110 [Acidiphilium sp.]
MPGRRTHGPVARSRIGGNRSGHPAEAIAVPLGMVRSNVNRVRPIVDPADLREVRNTMGSRESRRCAALGHKGVGRKGMVPKLEGRKETGRKPVGRKETGRKETGRKGLADPGDRVPARGKARTRKPSAAA